MVESEEGAATLTDYLSTPERTSMSVSMSIASAKLPSRAARARPLGVTFDVEECWLPLTENRAAGTLRGSLSGAPVRLEATFDLAPGEGESTVLHQVGIVESKIPIFAGRIEAGVREKVTEDFQRNCEYTEAWIDRNA